MNLDLTTQPPAKEDAQPITDEQAVEAMRLLGIDNQVQACQAYKKLGTWLIQTDIGTCQLARTFESEKEIDYAIEISRELCENGDPFVRSNGVKNLLLAVKTRNSLAEQSIKLADAAARKGRPRGSNQPPVFNGPVTVITEKPPIPV